MRGRLDGSLAVSRALGDFNYKVTTVLREQGNSTDLHVPGNLGSRANR